jgi:hypothetical protein
MKRTAIAAAWIFGTTIPVLASVVFLFGCCALPFHSVVHKVMPICHLAVQFIRGDAVATSDAQQPLPAREKQEPAKRIATNAPRSRELASTSVSTSTLARTLTATNAVAYRSFIALGAIRCDRDVGLHLLAGTLLI